MRRSCAPRRRQWSRTEVNDRTRSRREARPDRRGRTCSAASSRWARRGGWSGRAPDERSGALFEYLTGDWHEVHDDRDDGRGHACACAAAGGLGGPAARPRGGRLGLRADRGGARPAGRVAGALRVSACAGPARDGEQRLRDARLVRHQGVHARGPCGCGGTRRVHATGGRLPRGGDGSRRRRVAHRARRLLAGRRGGVERRAAFRRAAGGPARALDLPAVSRRRSPPASRRRTRTCRS